MTAHNELAVGIDLGTTYSCIAHIDEFDRATVIGNRQNVLTTPSVVLFDPGSRTVGQEAKSMSKAMPDQVVELVKRQMGNPDYRYEYDGTEHTAPEISAYILRKLVDDAEFALGRTIEKVVITCPAYFGITETEATAAAGRIAGLEVLGVIHEPVAAAIAWANRQEQKQDRHILVYDLGGGTFDVTYIRVIGEGIVVEATGGNHDLGGRNWDEAIVLYLAQQWQNEHGADQDPLDDPEVVNDLFLQAEAAKQSITQKGTGRIAIRFAGKTTKVNLDREAFDSQTSHLLESTIGYTNDLMRDVHTMGHPDPDIILLVGGSTYMPQVADRLAQEYGIQPEQFDPDQAVAKGAALYARMIIDGVIPPIGENPDPGPTPAPPPPIEQGISRSFGVVAWKEVDGQHHELVSNIIKKYSHLPASATRTYGTMQDNQGTVEIQIMENLIWDDEATPEQSKQIGTVTLPLPPGLPAGSPIEITCHLDQSGLLHIAGRDMTGNQSITAEVRTEEIMTEAELERMAEDFKGLLIE